MGRGLPRLCKHCEERFQPTSRHNKFCDNCKKASMWQRFKKWGPYKKQGNIKIQEK